MGIRLSRRDPKVPRLRAVPGFAGVSDDELERLARLVDEARLKAGALLTRQGYFGIECFLVAVGEAGVYVDGRRVGTARPGDFVGEMGLLRSTVRTATVKADTAMDVFVIGPQAFPMLLGIDAVTRRMLGALSERLTDAQGSDRCPT